MCIYTYTYINVCGPGSSTYIATDKGLDGPGSNSCGDEIVRRSRPDLGAIQPNVKWVLSLFRGKVRPGCAADHSPPSSAAVVDEKTYISTHLLDNTGLVTQIFYDIYACVCIYIYTSIRKQQK